MRLLNHLVENGLSADLGASNSWLDLFDRWSHALQLSTVDDGLAEARQNLVRISEAADNVSTATGLDEIFEPVLRGLAAISRAHLNTAVSFQENADAYITPDHYLNSRRWVDPVVRYTFGTGALHIPKSEAELEREGKYVHWGTSDQNGVNAVSFGYSLKVSGIPCMDVRLAFEVFDLFGVVDFVLETSGRLREDVQRPGKMFFAQRDLTPFEVF
jgi:hypothetical protein